MIPAPDISNESPLWACGLTRLAGLDEAGRGALAGPVAAGAVVLPHDLPALIESLRGLRDSKLLSALQRARLAPRIQACALAWGVGFASAREIDNLGIVPSTRLAALRALEVLGPLPDYLLTDFRLELPETGLPQTSLVKGDQRSLSIAAASVLAKTARDALLCGFEDKYPGYGFARHKGYGTRLHREAIARLGYCEVHRRSFVIKQLTVDG
jgi:ribonuclease HII